ncbi:MAG: hypothetical protein D6731_11405 [Planctomycetota bacterium]|nr:MAG: hypothetical protein D6731_11405 [Planctomycetota bacterium]
MSRRAFAWSVLALLAGCHPSACGAFLSPPDALPPEQPPLVTAQAEAGPLEVGAARVDFRFPGSVWLAGFGFCRPSEGQADPLAARAIALRRGKLTALVIGCDLVGLHNYQVQALRKRLSDVATPDAVLLAATHTHSGPDTLGLWGLLPPLCSGLEDEVVDEVLRAIEAAARAAVDRLEPARARWACAEAPERGVSRNRRDPEWIDRRLTAVAFEALDGRPIATLVHFACHPEGLGSKNRLLSADFPAGLYERVEGERGGVCVFLNGALGGMVTLDAPDHSLAAVRAVGVRLGDLALAALASSSRALPRSPALRAVRQPLWVPVQNRSYHLAHAFSILGPRPFRNGCTQSEVFALALGPLVLLSVPGEALPRLGFELEERVAGEPVLLVGLGGDELGYLLRPEDWEAERYHYERSVSPGPLAGELLRWAVEAVATALARPPAEATRGR